MTKSRKRNWIVIKLICSLFLALSAGSMKAQDTEFWFTVPHLSEQLASGVPLNMPAFLAISNGTYQSANVVITRYNGGTSIVDTQFISPGQLYRLDFSNQTAMQTIQNPRDFAGNVTKFGIHITSDVPVTAYYMANSPDSRDIFTLKGQKALGTLFYVPMQSDNFEPTGPYLGAFDQIDIVATEDNTTVTVVPKTAVRIGVSGSSPAGTPIVRTLDKGETLKIMEHLVNSLPSLAGTSITATAPVAVTVSEDLVLGDTSGDQIVPVSSVGKRYVIAKGYMTVANKERVYMVATADSTSIKINNVTVANNLNAGDSYVFVFPSTDDVVYVEADNPIYCYQRTGFNEQGAALLPSMYSLSQKRVTFFQIQAQQEKAFVIFKTDTDSSFTITYNNTTDSLKIGSPIAVPGVSEWKCGRFDLPSAANNQVVTIENPESNFSLGYIGANQSGNVMTFFGYLSQFGTLSFADTTYMCDGSPVTLDAGYALSYDWTLPNGSHLNTPTINVTDTGTYTVVVDTDPTILTASTKVLRRFESSALLSSSVSNMGAGTYTYTADPGIYPPNNVGYTWMVDGTTVSANPQFTITWNAEDEKLITLLLQDTAIGCSKTHTLIHHKKPDNISDAECYVDAPATIWDIEQKAVSDVEVHALATPFVGDLDGDGRVEVVVPNNVGYPNTASAILILDDSLKLIRTISPPTPMPNYGTMSLAIADVDNDGFGEIVVATIDSQLICYSHLGVQKWITTVKYTPQLSANDCISLIISDINGDEYCEILAANNIYAGESGILLATLPAGGRGYAEGGPSSFMPVFADIDNDGIQEVAAGNTVYKVTITNRSGTAGNSAVIYSQINLPDGFTSVADINLDGRPDIIVTGGHATLASTAIMYVWDGMTGAQIGNTVSVGSASKRISRAFAGDITGNGRPDIAFTYANRIEAYSYDPGLNQFIQLWQRGTSDASGATTMSMFDFDQNGEVELVYRDMDSLRIINKLGNNIITFPCYSATHTEYPVIVDIDKDGHADILVSGRLNNSDPDTRIIRYSSITPNQWASARSVWNQHAYNAVHINEDLSVPRFPLNPATAFPGHSGLFDERPYNNFLQQQTILNKDGVSLWLSPDVDTVLSTVQTTVNGNTVTVTVDFFNYGQAPIGPPVYVSLYKESSPQAYTSAEFIATDSLNSPIAQGASGQVVIVIPDITPYLPFANMVIRLNDDGVTFPYQAECDTLNNEITILNPARHLMMKKDAVLFIPPSDSIVHNGFLSNPVAAFFGDTIEYRISAINGYMSSANILIRDTLPAWLKYVNNSADPPASDYAVGTTQTGLVWSVPTLSMDTAHVRFRATLEQGVSASQPLFANRAWISINSDIVPTNFTYHQGVDVSTVTFSAGFGGNIYNAKEQVLDYRTSPGAGIVIVPDEGYRFAGWSHADYMSLRGETIRANSGIMRYDTLTVYGNVALRADFELEVYPIVYHLNEGRFPDSFYSQFSITSPTITLAAPQKAGDIFTGWTGSNGDEPQLTVTIPAGSTGERVYYAHFLHSGRIQEAQPEDNTETDRIWTGKNELFVRTTTAGGILRIYSLDGVLQKQQLILQPGETTYKLQSGLYIVTLNNGIGQTVRIE